MRVAIDITSFPVGGQERQVAQLAFGLASRGHSVLLVINKSGSAFRDTLDHPGVEVVELGRLSRYDLRVLPDIVRRLRAFRPDVVLCVGYNATLWGRIAAVVLRIPVVTAEHESTQIRRKLDRVLTNRMLAPFTRAVVACASGQTQYLIADGCPADKIVVIQNGVDSSQFKPQRDRGLALRQEWGVPEGAVLVGIVATHRPEKRHDRFIALIETCLVSGVDIYGVMIGDGDLQEDNQRAALSSSASDHLIVAGDVSDMPAVYNACDVVVLVSDSVEVFPLAFIEAEACGVPVVGFDIGGVGETMRDGVTGYLVTADDEDLLARRVVELSTDPALRRSMGDAGRSWVSEHLTVEVMVSTYETLLKGVARGASAS